MRWFLPCSPMRVTLHSKSILLSCFFYPWFNHDHKNCQYCSSKIKQIEQYAWMSCRSLSKLYFMQCAGVRVKSAICWIMATGSCLFVWLSLDVPLTCEKCLLLDFLLKIDLWLYVAKYASVHYLSCFSAKWNNVLVQWPYAQRISTSFLPPTHLRHTAYPIPT